MIRSNMSNDVQDKESYVYLEHPSFSKLVVYEYNYAMTVLDFRIFTLFLNGTAENEKVQISEIFSTYLQ